MPSDELSRGSFSAKIDFPTECEILEMQMRLAESSSSFPPIDKIAKTIVTFAADRIEARISAANATFAV